MQRVYGLILMQLRRRGMRLFLCGSATPMMERMTFPNWRCLKLSSRLCMYPLAMAVSMCRFFGVQLFTDDHDVGVKLLFVFG